MISRDRTPQHKMRLRLIQTSRCAYPRNVINYSRPAAEPVPTCSYHYRFRRIVDLDYEPLIPSKRRPTGHLGMISTLFHQALRCGK